MTTSVEIVRQHLIDPELCIRCNTCEETCPIGAISNDYTNYVVDASICNGCMACVKPCPTGAIDNWRTMIKSQAYTLEQQFGWQALPEKILIPADQLPADFSARFPSADSNEASEAAIENLFSLKHPALGVISENTRLTGAATQADIRHIVLDLGAQHFPFLEGQSVGIIPPGLDLNGKPHIMRLYSVASPRDGEAGKGGHLALTVKRVLEDHEGAPVPGVCSNYLADLKPGDEVKLVGPYGADFLMPADDRHPLIMICTGTGVAPMRAMIQRRLALGREDAGQQMLFYGSRTPEETAYYDDLQALAGPALDLTFAFSRLAGQPKRYVQEAVQERHEQLAQLLSDGSSQVYLCGLKGMENGVFEAFRAVCTRYAIDWDTLRAEMLEQSRLHVETY